MAELGDGAKISVTVLGNSQAQKCGRMGQKEIPLRPKDAGSTVHEVPLQLMQAMHTDV